MIAGVMLCLLVSLLYQSGIDRCEAASVSLGHKDLKTDSELNIVTILDIIRGTALVPYNQKMTKLVDFMFGNNVDSKPIQTQDMTKRHNFVRNRRPMADCLSNCIRRVQRVIACKNLCF